jgi:retinal pigment epithelial membrane protein
LSATNPFLNGYFEPLYDEYSVSKLRVEGEIPRELNGALYRNTTNQRFRPFNPDQTHWFEGDAMLAVAATPSSVRLSAKRSRHRCRSILRGLSRGPPNSCSAFTTRCTCGVHAMLPFLLGVQGHRVAMLMREFVPGELLHRLQHLRRRRARRHREHNVKGLTRLSSRPIRADLAARVR